MSDDPASFCKACGEVITDVFVQALDFAWHPEHFNCVKCKINLAGRKYLVLGHQPVCDVCGTSALVKCSYCDKIIEGRFKAIRLDEKSEKKHFHEHCVKCGDCGVELGNNIFLREGDREHLYCEDHRRTDLAKVRVTKKAPLRQLPLCSICNDKSRHHEWNCPKKSPSVKNLNGEETNNKKKDEGGESLKKKEDEKEIRKGDDKVEKPKDDVKKSIEEKVSAPIKGESSSSSPKNKPSEPPSSSPKATVPISPKTTSANTNLPTSKPNISAPSLPVPKITTSSTAPTTVPLTTNTTDASSDDVSRTRTTTVSHPPEASLEVIKNKTELHDVLRRKLTYDNIEERDSRAMVYYSKVVDSILFDVDLDKKNVKEGRMKISNSIDNMLEFLETTSKPVYKQSVAKIEYNFLKEQSFLSSKNEKSEKTLSIKIDGKDRKVIKEGYLTKSGKNGKDWKKRWIVLLDGELLYFDTINAKKPNGSVDLKGSTIRPTKDLATIAPPLPFNFQIVDRSLRLWTFCVENDTEMISWFTAIAQVAGLPIEQLEERLGADAKKHTLSPDRKESAVPLGGSALKEKEKSEKKEKIIKEEDLLVMMKKDKKKESFSPFWVKMDLKTLQFGNSEEDKHVVDLRNSHFHLGPHDLGVKYVFNIKTELGVVFYFAASSESHLFAWKDSFEKAKKIRDMAKDK